MTRTPKKPPLYSVVRPPFSTSRPRGPMPDAYAYAMLLAPMLEPGTVCSFQVRHTEAGGRGAHGMVARLKTRVVKLRARGMVGADESWDVEVATDPGALIGVVHLRYNGPGLGGRDVREVLGWLPTTILRDVEAAARRGLEAPAGAVSVGRGGEEASAEEAQAHHPVRTVIEETPEDIVKAAEALLAGGEPEAQPGTSLLPDDGGDGDGGDRYLYDDGGVGGIEL